MKLVRGAALALAWILIVPGALLLSAWLHLQWISEGVLRRGAAEMVSTFVSGEIEGELRIGRVTELSTTRIVTRNVEVIDPNGTRVAVADEVVLIPNLDSAFEGTLHFSHVELRRGTIRLIEVPGTSAPTFVQAFAPARPNPDRTTPGLHAIVGDIHTEDVTVYGDILGLRNLRVENVRAHGRIEAQEHLVIDFYDVTGDVVMPFPFPIHLDRASGSFSTHAATGLQLRGARAHTPQGDQIRANVFFRAPPGSGEDARQELDLLVQGDPIHISTLRGLGFDWADLFVGEARGHYRMTGHAEDWRIRANLVSNGGPLYLDGRILPDRFELAGSTPGLALERSVAQAPELTAAGHGRLVVRQPPPGTLDEDPTFHLELVPLTWEGWRFPSLAIDGTLDEPHVRIDHIHSDHLDGHIHAEGTVGYDAAVDLHITAGVPRVGRDPNVRSSAPGLDGNVDADFHLRIDPADPDRPERPRRIALRGRAGFRRFRFSNLTADSLRFSGTVAGDLRRPVVHVDVDGRGVAVGGFPIGTADLTLDGGPREYQARGRFLAEDQRRIEFDASIAADGNRWNVNAPRIELAIGELVWRGQATNVVYVPGDALHYGQLVLANGTQRLESHGVYRFRGPEDIDAQLQDFDLAAVRAVLGDDAPDIGGRVDTHLVIAGDIARPNLTIEGALRDGRFQEVDDIASVYLITYDDGALSYDGQLDFGDRGALSLNGTANLDPTIADPIEALRTGSYQAQIDLGNLDLVLLRRLTRDAIPEMTGRVAGSIQIGGTTDNPSFAGSMRIASLQIPGWSPLILETGFDYGMGMLTGRIEVADERGDLFESEGTATIDLPALARRDTSEMMRELERTPWRISVRTEPRRLDEMPLPIRVIAPYPARFAVNLTAAGGGAIASTADLVANIDWLGELGDDDCGAGAAPRVLVEAHLRGGRTTARARGFLARQAVLEVEASAATPLDRWLEAGVIPDPPPTAVTARMLAPRAQEIPFICSWVSGEIAAAAQIHDLFSESPAAEIDVRSNALSFVEVDPMEVNVDARIQSNALTLEATLRGAGGEETEVEASLPFRWGGTQIVPALAEDGPVRIHADFDNAPLAPLLATVPNIVDAHGSASGHMLIQGPINRLSMEGAIQVSDGYLELVGLGQQLTDVNGRLVLHDGWVQIDGLTATDGDGRVSIDGGVGFDGLIPRRWRLSLNGTRFPVRREGIVLATLTGRARLEATTGDERADGTLTVNQLTIRLPEQSARSLQPLEDHLDIQVEGADERVADDDLYPIFLHVDARRDFWVRRTDFSARVVSELNVTYRDPDLLVSGYANLRRGFFEIFGRRFDVERGTMNFDGGRDLNPAVELQAVHQLRGTDYHVWVNVTGRFATPSITFTSDDPRANDQGAALALLVSGRQRQSSTNDDAGSTEDAQRQAGDFLAGLMAGILTLSARRELGDVIPVIVIESGDDAFQSARLRAGFQADSVIPEWMRGVVRGAYVEGFVAGTTAQSEDTQAQRATGGVLLELQFPQNFVGTVQTQQGDNGLGWGVDLTWEP